MMDVGVVGKQVMFVRFALARNGSKQGAIISAKISGERRIHSPLGFPSYA